MGLTNEKLPYDDATARCFPPASLLDWFVVVVVALHCYFVHVCFYVGHGRMLVRSFVCVCLFACCFFTFSFIVMGYRPLIAACHVCVFVCCSPFLIS